jgi:hypothetical protein
MGFRRFGEHADPRSEGVLDIRRANRWPAPKTTLILVHSPACRAIFGYALAMFGGTSGAFRMDQITLDDPVAACVRQSFEVPPWPGGGAAFGEGRVCGIVG